MLRPCRFALRQIRKHLVFSGFIIGTLAIGVGANIAVFSVLNALLLADLPVERPQELRRVVPRSHQAEDQGFSDELFQAFVRTQTAFDEIYGASSVEAMEAVTAGASSRVHAQLVSGDYFRTLGIPPHVGRLFDAEDERSGQPVAVLSHRYWSSKLGQDPAAVGRLLSVNRLPLTVVGVAPPRFGGDVVGQEVDVWVPLSLHRRLYSVLGATSPGAWVSFIHVIGRQPAGAGDAVIEASLDLTLRQLAASGEAWTGQLEEIAGLDVVPASRGVSPARERFSRPLLALIAMVGAVLLLTCLNVANLLLTRSVHRQQEFATRIAIGASGGHLFRQLLLEYLFLAGLGGVVGVTAGLWLRALVVTWLGPVDLPTRFDVAQDAPILAYGLGLTVLAGLAFALGPAWRVSRIAPAAGLRRGAGRREQVRASRVVVIAQVALSFLLVFMATMFLSTLRNLEHTETGFARQGVLQLTVEAAANGSTSATQRYLDLSRRLEALPGVRRSGFAWMGLVGGGSASLCCVTGEGQTAGAGDGHEVGFNVVSPGYFEAVGMKLLEGRGFADHDLSGSGAVVINRALAFDLFGRDPAVGRRIRLDTGGGSPTELEVVGVAADAKYFSLRDPQTSMMFVLPTTIGLQLQHLMVSTAIASDTVLPTALQAIAAEGGGFSVSAIDTVEAILDRDLAQERLVAKLTLAFGVLALALTAVGLYGAIFYKVIHRMKEIGIRIALGARRHEILWLVLRDVLVLLGLGGIIGLGSALASARFVTHLLYGVTPADPTTIALTLAIMIAVAAAASASPALRAISVEPSLVLRQE